MCPESDRNLSESWLVAPNLRKNVFIVSKKSMSFLSLAGVISLTGCPGPGPTETKVDPDPQPQPSLSLTAQRVGGISISYDVSFENLTQANLTVTRNGSAVSEMSRTITTANKSGTYNDQRKGDYFLTVTGGGVSTSSTVTIPNFPPQADFNDLDNSVKHNSQITWQLESMLADVDINYEDNPVPLVSVTSLGEVIQINIDGYEVSLTTGDISGEELIEIVYGSQDGMFGRDTLSFNIQPSVLARISGRIENNRTDLGESSQMNVYNGIVSPETFLGQIITSDGDFGFQLTEEIQGPIILRTQLGQDSYVRTISIPAADTSGLIMRSHPKDQPYDLRLHMEEINSGFFKWNLYAIKGVSIVDGPEGKGSFTSAEKDFVEAIFRENLGCYTGNHSTIQNLRIEKDDNDPSDYAGKGQDNWIFITRDTTMTLGGLASTKYDDNGNIYKSVISLRDSPTSYATSHEQGHSFVAPISHAQTLPGTVTIMRGDVQSQLNSPGPADCEARTVLYEDTYTAGSSYDDVLGTEFNEIISGIPGITIIQ